jgi:phage gpG-like protein
MLSLAELIQLLGAADFAKVWQSLIRPVMLLSVSGVRTHFDQSRGPDGKQWAPLAHNRPEGAGKPLLDKGLLAASVSASVTANQITLSANSPGARLQQYGGKILPVRGKWLTIPVTVEAKRIGSPRQNHFPRPLFFRATTNPLTALLCETDPTGRIVVQYVLKPDVTIPARPYLGWSEATLTKIQKLIADRAMKALLAKFKLRS